MTPHVRRDLISDLPTFAICNLQSGQDDEKSHPPNGSMLQNGNQNGKDPQHSSESNIGNGSPSSSPRRIIAFVGGIDLTGKSKPKCAFH